MDKIFRIHPSDNVAVALKDLKAGETAAAGVTVREDIKSGHKIALQDIAPGENIMKYGFPIGTASAPIPAGAWVHTHNVKTRLGDLLAYSYHPSFQPLPAAPPRTFAGYRRKDGSVGIRNEVWIIPTVGCVNGVVREIERQSQRFLTPEIDGVYSYTHPYGCSQLGEDLANTQRILAGLIRHSNAGAVLVVGLGCENNTLAQMKKAIGSYDENRVKFLVCQEHEDEVAEGVRLTGQLCRYAAQFHREPCAAGELTVGLKCGGSDGFSGITANPLVGVFSDRLISQGGTTVLTEVPEMFGAEMLLMRRCRNRDVFEKTVVLINNFKRYFIDHHQKIDSNPSPGNKSGGITTLEEKSLGCVQKGGTAPVCDVLPYGGPVVQKGLNLLQAPGNDLVASAALAASGAQLVLFTTGRGTPFGCPVPTVKIASNSSLAHRKPGWIDFDAGKLLFGADMQALSSEFFDYVLDIASGVKKTKSESLDKHDLAIFKNGITL